MPTQEESRVAAYVKLRMNNSQAQASVSSQIAAVQEQLVQLQTALAGERTLAAFRNQGLLFAWARIRANAEQELAILARQPWFQSLSYAPGTQPVGSQPLPQWLLQAGKPPPGEGLRLTARLEDGASFSLWVRPAVYPAIHADPEKLPTRANHDGLLFESVLAALAAEGRLADAVAAYAQRHGLHLAQSLERPHKVKEIGTEAAQHYFLQRTAWLIEDREIEMTEAVATDNLVRQIDDLQRKLFVLDEQRRQLTLPHHEQQQVAAYVQEWQALCQLPSVRSIDVQGERCVLRTAAIYIRGILVGEFRVDIDFAASSIRIFNETKPVLEENTRFDHPHVRDSNICAGNIAKAIADRLASRNLLELVSLLIDFLGSYNPGSPHRALEHWG